MWIDHLPLQSVSPQSPLTMCSTRRARRNRWAPPAAASSQSDECHGGKRSDLTFTFKLFLFVGASFTAANQWRDGQAAAGAGETERQLLYLRSGAASFVGCICWYVKQRRPTNGAFISWIWRLHQMDPARPSLSQNAVWPGFWSVWDDEVTMGGASCHHQLMRQKLRHGQLMMQHWHLP